MEEGGSYVPLLYASSSQSFARLDFFLMDHAGGGGAAAKKGADNAKLREAAEEKRRREAEAKASKGGKDAKAKKKKKQQPKKKKSGGGGKVALKSTRKLPQPADPVMLATADLDALSIAELRGVLARWDDPCTGCAERYNFVSKIEAHRKAYGDLDAEAKRFGKKARKKGKAGEGGVAAAVKT